MVNKINIIKIAVLTGSRADYGYLKNLCSVLANDKGISLNIIVTGMHLSPEFGQTESAIIDDGFKIHDKVEMLLSSDTRIGMIKSIKI